MVQNLVVQENLPAYDVGLLLEGCKRNYSQEERDRQSEKRKAISGSRNSSGKTLGFVWGIISCWELWKNIRHNNMKKKISDLGQEGT